MAKLKTDSPKKRSGRLTVTLGTDQRRKIEIIAKRLRTSAATIIRWALDEYIARSEKPPKPNSRKPR